MDFWEGTLLLVLLESLDESAVLKLARDRRRRSLRKAMFGRSSWQVSVEWSHGAAGNRVAVQVSIGW